MASSYPGAIDTLATNKQDDTVSQTGADAGLTTTTGDHPQHHNDMADAINKIEAELGVSPKGLYAPTVRERFEISAYKNQSCKVATTAALPTVTYSNGSSGVGATLTASATGAWAAIDSITLALGDRILVKDQASAFQNGIYTVTTLGAVGVAMVLTRAIDADTSAKIADIRVLIDQGSQQGDTEWGQATTAPVMGTNALAFKRTNPIYGHGNPRFPWEIGASLTALPIMATIPRVLVSAAFSTATALVEYAIGGIVVPAGRTVTNVNYIATVAGGTVTTDWFALARQSDRLTMGHTANTTTAPTINVVTTRALATPWTPSYDTPVWVYWTLSIATTPRQVAAGPAGTAAINGFAPAIATTCTTPSATVPTDNSTVLPALATTGIANVLAFWLT